METLGAMSQRAHHKHTHLQWIFFNSSLTNSLKDNMSDEFMSVWDDLFLYSLRNIDFLEDPF